MFSQKMWWVAGLALIIVLAGAVYGLQRVMQSRPDCTGWSDYRNPAWDREAVMAGSEEPYFKQDGFFARADNHTIRHCVRAGKPLGALGEDGTTPLHMAVLFNRNPDVIAALIEAGADIEARGHRDRTVLHQAAANKNPAVIMALIDAGADVKARDYWGTTPLRKAVDNENLEVIDVLIKAGADPNARGGFNVSLLHRAAAHSENPAVITALIEAGADIGARDADGYLPVDYIGEKSPLYDSDVYWMLKQAAHD